jgi:hypothetical protein
MMMIEADRVRKNSHFPRKRPSRQPLRGFLRVRQVFARLGLILRSGRLRPRLEGWATGEARVFPRAANTWWKARRGRELPRRVVIGLPIALLMVLPSRRAAPQTESPTDSGPATLPRLTYAGTELAPVTVDPAYIDIRVVVDVAGDLPMASYMAARPRGLSALQRTAAGAWVEWDQRPDSLVDNGFAVFDGSLVFAERGADFSEQSFPIALEVAYRTAAGVKFGQLTMISRR